MRQIDIKKVIAYTSVAHMSLCVLGLLSLSNIALTGGLFIMIAHGFVSSALFLCVGLLYERIHTKVMYYVAGLAFTMPLYAFFVFLFSISNFGFPGTANFVGELLIFLGISINNVSVLFLLFPGFFLGIAYSMWLFNRLFFTTTAKHLSNIYVSDLNRFEWFLLLAYAFFTLFLGMIPMSLISFFFNNYGICVF
jgi:NADH:ubiquinone oxidoreductase subunit 4 (subunit M)